MRHFPRLAYGVAAALTYLCIDAVHADEATIRKTLTAYAEAYNKHDAKALGSIWAVTATHFDRVTGIRTAGREAIEADLAKSLESRSGVHLSAQIDQIRMIKPDVVSVEGRTSVGVPGEEPEVSAFSAIMIKEGDAWLFDTVEELPAAPVSTSALKDLEWLIGTWVDESAEGRVESTYRWSASGAFMLRSFAVIDAEGVKHQGTQVIGWDPRGQQIRSWTFNSDGSFGDGAWSRNNDAWLVQSTSVLPDGRPAAGTYVMTQVDGNTLNVQLIGHSIDGEPQPNSEVVKVVRQGEAATKAEDPAPSPSSK